MAAAAFLLGVAGARGAAAQASDVDLAKALSNPISSLISVPLQFNYDQGFGPQDGEQFLLNVQPVVPLSLNDDWNLISRTILPIVSQNDVVPGREESGLGDTVQSLFFSPKAPGPNGVIWGVGPVALLPTATDRTLGSNKWGAGPTGVALRQSGPWTYGLLANHIWSFAGDDDRRDVSSSFIQPFVTYTTRSATTIALNSETTYDWQGDKIQVPINLQVNQLLNVAGQRIQVGAGLRYWAASPDAGPEGFGFRVNLVFLFPAGN